MPTHDPLGQYIVERGNMVGKLKEGNYNSLNVHGRAEGRAEWKGERVRVKRCGNEGLVTFCCEVFLVQALLTV